VTAADHRDDLDDRDIDLVLRRGPPVAASSPLLTSGCFACAAAARWVSAMSSLARCWGRRNDVTSHVVQQVSKTALPPSEVVIAAADEPGVHLQAPEADRPRLVARRSVRRVGSAATVPAIVSPVAPVVSPVFSPV
jgi:hypothetical protein